MMEKDFLYLQIAEAIRKQIIEGTIHPGDRLPPVRELITEWHCTPGTVHRAYKQLANEGLIVGRSGQGTRVLSHVAHPHTTPAIRKASLVNKAEAFLLEAVASGYTENDIETALQAALDRWRSIKPATPQHAENIIRFAGSHDPVLMNLVRDFSRKHPQDGFEIHFHGSLGGLILLSQGQVDLAGCHLWDEPTNSYNLPFVQKVLPGKKVHLVNMAIRQIGIALPPGNPQQINALEQVTQPGVIWVDRQAGSGIRVWTDAHFKKYHIDPEHIHRYPHEAMTHTQVAKWIAEGSATMGCCLEYSAREFELDFIPLAKEEYDLVTTQDVHTGVMKRFMDYLGSNPARKLIARHAGYHATHTGELSLIGE
ncbi:MAG: GntR family transcriptional regulator [Anaerolineae bacterium]|jgi:putative molybdopterin biosynthesis protein|nr:GntR family transcriptional regulator [Anaerolineae bacterium]